ncbi:histidinol-phosphate transaminase [Eggerthellaceae bacterium 3-80]|nr:histidinol-phosphate transaminase [bacterium D16-34]
MTSYAQTVCPSAPQLADLVPYDPKYLPADAFLSANENPRDVDEELRRQIMRALREVDFNRYPDPLANNLRDMIAEANGVSRDQVLVGNGGDELLFDIALAWGGPGRKFLNMPPTFSVYENNAQLTNTEVVSVVRDENYDIDEEAVLARVAEGDIDYAIVTSPNNPTGRLADEQFILKLLESTNALVVVDEAYFEFSRKTIRPYLERFENLLILRTFSKAFSLAGVRVGYVLGAPSVIREFIKVRQPYSVDAVSQAIAQVIYENRAQFEPGISAIIAERSRVFDELRRIAKVVPYPSDANYILFSVPQAQRVWQALYDRGILIRDLSGARHLEDCLRVTIGTEEQNNAFLDALRVVLADLAREQLQN